MLNWHTLLGTTPKQNTNARQKEGVPGDAIVLIDAHLDRRRAPCSNTQSSKIMASNVSSSTAGCSSQEDSLLDGVPSLNERLGQLRPSRELLEYYRQKIAEYDGEYEKLLKKLEKYKCTYEHVHKSEWEIRQREEEIGELQKALSDMQVFLFQEREHVLRLYAENDRLKIKELEDRKRIQHLLTLSRQPVAAEGETTYFFQDKSTRRVVIQEHRRSKRAPTSDPQRQGRGPGGHKTSTNPCENKSRSDGEGCNHEDHETLLLTVESLKAQLEEQTRLCKEQVDSLLEDRRVRLEEYQALQDRDTERIRLLDEQLHKTQRLLYESTKDYLDLKYTSRAKEREHMAERDHLLQRLDKVREEFDVVEGVDPVLGVSMSREPSRRRRHNRARNPGPPLKEIQVQLEQAQQLADDYREQCIATEEELARVKDETEASKGLFKERTDKLTKRLDLMNARYEALERRKGLEIEGYKNDVRLLRQRLKEVEKQLFKLTLSLTGDQDMQILTQVKRTASNSKKLVGDLQSLKAALYSLERDARNVHN